MPCALTLLGGFSAEVDDRVIPDEQWRHRRAAQLVKILALAPNHRLTGEQLVDLMWPDLSPHAGAANVRKAAHHARTTLGAPEAVVLKEGLVSLFPQTEMTIDAEQFERSVDLALRDGNISDAADAADRYTGDLLPDDRYEEWAAEPRDRLRWKYLEALRKAGAWERVTHEEPADEEAARALIRAWLERGNRHAAMRQFTLLQDHLARELGVRPSAETLELLSQIRAVTPPAPHHSPLVGREAELERALAGWAQAREGRGSVLLLSGEAGIGKTRFCEELVAAATADDAAVLRGAAHEDEASTAFGMVRRIVDDLIVERPELDALLGPDARGLVSGSAARSPGGLSWREAAAPGIEWQRFSSSVSQLVTSTAQSNGLLMVMEDVHDADAGSLKLIGHLATVVAQEPVLLVVTHRSESSAPTLGRLRAQLLQQGHVTELRLDRLDRDAVKALVADRNGAPTEAVLNEIWELAQGIPFYTEELAASLEPEGRIEVPERIYEVIWARLDMLDAQTRQVLRQLAVAAETFTVDDVVALVAGDWDTAAACLDEALATGVIEERGSSYRFRHALTRRALERSLPRHRRRQVHAECAARLAEVDGAAARVAYHLQQAGDHPAAVPWLERAALEAAALGAYGDGLRLTTEASALAPPGDRARLLALRADMLYSTGDSAAASAYDAAVATAAPEERPRLWTMKARVLLAADNADEAARALEYAEPTRPEDQIDAQLVSGLVAWARGSVDAAEQDAMAAREQSITHGYLPGLSEAAELLGLVAHSRGQWRDRVNDELTDLIRRPEQVAASVFDAHLCLAEYLLYGQQPYDEVIDFAAELRATATQSGAGRGVAFATCVLGEAELLSGQLGSAEEHLQQAAALHEAVGANAGMALSLQRLAELAVAQHDLERATTLLDEAERVSHGLTLERHLLGKIYGTRVRATLDPAAAMRVVERGEAQMAEVPVCQPCTIGFFVAASIAASRSGDVAVATQYLLRTERVAAAWPGGGWHAAVLECRAALAAAQGDEEAATALLERAVQRFEQAGQPVDAERCRTGRG